MSLGFTQICSRIHTNTYMQVTKASAVEDKLLFHFFLILRRYHLSVTTYPLVLPKVRRSSTAVQFVSTRVLFTKAIINLYLLCTLVIFNQYGSRKNMDKLTCGKLCQF